MSFRTSLTAAVLAGALALGYPSAYFCLHAGSWLVIKDDVPVRLDYLFTFGGERVRDTYSQGLFSAHPEAVWVLSNANPGARNALQARGFDTTRIILVDTCSNTRSEAAFLQELLRRRNAGDVPCVGLVSGPYHMRRIARDLRLRRQEPAADFRFLPVPFDYYRHTPESYRNFFFNPQMRALVCMELRKMAAHAFIDRFTSPHKGTT